MALKLKYLKNTFADITARNAIPSDDRFDGMKVNVLDDGAGLYKGFQLQGGIDNGNWTDLNIILTDGVDTIAIINGAVTNVKLNPMAQSTIKGRSAESGTGTPEDLTPTEVRTIINVEDGADVTDNINVNAAGATMNADITLAGNGYFLDEDNMASDDNTKVASQQSIKKYVDDEVALAIAGGAIFKGDYNAATNTPDLDTSPIATGIGDMYVATTAGTFFATTILEIGDILISKVVNATLESDWTVVQANLTSASIKIQYESNSNTNAFTNSEQTKLSGIESGATADQDDSEIETAYNNEVSVVSQADAETGTSDVVKRWTPERVKQAIAALETNTSPTITSASITTTAGLTSIVFNESVVMEFSNYYYIYIRLSGTTNATIVRMAISGLTVSTATGDCKPVFELPFSDHNNHPNALVETFVDATYEMRCIPVVDATTFTLFSTFVVHKVP